MAEKKEDRRRPDSEAEESGRRRLSPRDIWGLIFSSYRSSLPYLLVFIGGLLLVTWIVTELVF